DCADRGVNLARRRKREDAIHATLHRSFEPLIAEVDWRAFLWILEQRVTKPECAPRGVEVERPLDAGILRPGDHRRADQQHRAHHNSGHASTSARVVPSLARTSTPLLRTDPLKS